MKQDFMQERYDKFVTQEAGRITGVSGANISQVCKGKRKSVGGFLWTYKF